MTTRAALSWATAVVGALALASCSAPVPVGAWRVSPLPVHNSAFIQPDVTFMHSNLTDDTAGGVWSVSGASWLGISAEGVVTRFDEQREDGAGVLDVAALSPTLLYVLRQLGSGALNTTVEILDTATGQSEPVFAGQRVQTSPTAPLPFTPDGPVNASSPLGAIASIDVDPMGRLVFVERIDLPESPAAGYVVRRMLPGGLVETLAGSAEPGAGESEHSSPHDGEKVLGLRLAAASVEVAAGDPSGVIVSTPESVFQITADATARVIDGPLPLTTSEPDSSAISLGHSRRLVDAAADGSVVFGAAVRANPAQPMHFAGGSDRFKQIVQGPPGAPPLSVLDSADGAVTSSEAIQSAREAVWVAPGVLVVSIPGFRDDAAFARVEIARIRAQG